jgi:hypothetical protein
MELLAIFFWGGGGLSKIYNKLHYSLTFISEFTIYNIDYTTKLAWTPLVTKIRRHLKAGVKSVKSRNRFSHGWGKTREKRPLLHRHLHLATHPRLWTLFTVGKLYFLSKNVVSLSRFTLHLSMVVVINLLQCWWKFALYSTLYSSHRHLLRYENERPELIFSTKKKHIFKKCPKILLRELSCIGSFAISWSGPQKIRLFV